MKKILILPMVFFVGAGGWLSMHLLRSNPTQESLRVSLTRTREDPAIPEVAKSESNSISESHRESLGSSKVLEKTFLYLIREKNDSDENRDREFTYLISALNWKDNPIRMDVLDKLKTLIFLKVGKLQRGETEWNRVWTPGFRRLVKAYYSAANGEVEEDLKTLPKSSFFRRMIEELS